MTHSAGDYIKLHFIVLLFGFTGILGKLVSLPAVEMVFFRTVLAVLGMLVLIPLVKGSFSVSPSDFLKLFFTGFIVGIHWLTFFISGRIANVSVSLVGFATASLWTALIEPPVRGYRIRPVDLVLGLMVLSGLYIIYSSDFSYSFGLILAIGSGLTCAIFSIINSHLVTRVNALTITFYEMAGACMATVLFFPWYLREWSVSGQLELSPGMADWVYLLLLGWLCTVYAYSVGVELMKRISVFLFQLTLNLEPVYGIAMAVLIFGESEKMNVSFYIGTSIIVCAVLVYPWLKRKFTTTPTNS